MNVRKVALIAMVAVIAASSALAGTFHVKTKYFDLIYSEESRNSAAAIQKVADSLMEEISGEYNTPPLKNIPVLLVKGTDVFNGYFSAYNYNHIVLFDTVPQGDLMFFEEQMTNTFRHELTHLISSNCKEGFWKNVSGILGDVYNPAYFVVMPTFFHEGAAVYSESETGSGRLNTGNYASFVRQAKLSGKFPSYTDAFGARSVYPATRLSYIYGAEFTDFIIKKHGFEKYAQMWHNAGKFKRLTAPGIFKKTYGISMKKEWKNFYDSIDISGIDSDEILGAKGLEKKEFRTKSLHRYELGGASENLILVRDLSTGDIFLASNPGTENAGRKKIFSGSSIESARLSWNGRYISTTEISGNSLQNKITSSIYDLKDRKWIVQNKKVRELCPVELKGNFSGTEENLLLASISKGSDSQVSSLQVSSMDGTIIAEKSFPINEVPFNLVAGPDSSFYFLEKNFGSYNLFRAIITEGEITEVKFEFIPLGKINPENLSISYDGKTVTATFSYFREKSFGRSALVRIDGKSAGITWLDGTDFSGNTESPVVQDGKVFYCKTFIDESFICMAGIEDFENSPAARKETLAFEKLTADDEADPKNEEKLIQPELPGEKKYNRILYSGQTIAPVSSVQPYYLSSSVYFTDEVDCLGKSDSSFIGVSVLKNSPSDFLHLAMTAGTDIKNPYAGAGVVLMAKSQSDLINVTNTLNVIGNYKERDLEQITDEISSTLTLKTGRQSKVVFGDVLFMLHGKSAIEEDRMKELGYTQEQADQTYSYMRNIASVSWSNMHSTGPRTYERSGMTVGLNYKNVYAKAQCDKQDSIFRFYGEYDDCLKYSQLYPSATVKIPQLLPLENRGWFTFNIPFTCSGALVPSNLVFANLNMEAILFSWEIQKGLGVVPAFINNITLSGLWMHEYKHYVNRDMEIRFLESDFNNLDSMLHNEYAGGQVRVRVAGNTGALASPNINVNISCSVLKAIQGEHKGKTQARMTMGITANLF